MIYDPLPTERRAVMKRTGIDTKQVIEGYKRLNRKRPMIDRSTRNNVYDLVITSVYVVGLSIIAVFIFAAFKLAYIIIRH